jgi:phage terminase small subunit
MKKKQKITIRKQRFIDFYIESGNASESYVKAGYSQNGARQAARNLLTKTYIQEEIEQRRAEIAKEAGIKAQDIISEYKKIAFANSEDYFKWGESEIELSGGLKEKVSRILIKPPEDIDRDKRAAIAGIKEAASGGLEFKFHDKLKALDSLSKYLGIFNDAEIDKARQIKKTEELIRPDPTEGMTREEVDAKIRDLEDRTGHRVDRHEYDQFQKWKQSES